MSIKKVSSILAILKMVPGWVWPGLAFLVFAANTFFSGLLFQGAANDIDTRYFYTAAKMWSEGQSPYDVAGYIQTFGKIFGSSPMNGYPYLPTSMVFVLPMALFNWPEAAWLFRIFNTLAGVLLFWAVTDYLRLETGRALQPREWLWVTLGTSLGMVAANISTGQSALLMTSFAAVFLTGLRRSNPWLAALGLFMLTAKPTLSAIMILFVLFFEPKQWKALVLGTGLVLATFTGAWAVDGNLLGHILDSWSSYGNAGSNQVGNTLGWAGMMTGFGTDATFARLTGAAVLAMVAGFCGWSLKRSNKSFSHSPQAVGVIILATALLFPFHGYDAALFALPIILTALDWAPVKWWFFIPALMIWRPNLWAGILRMPDISNGILTLGWGLFLVGAVAYLGLKGIEKVRNKS